MRLPRILSLACLVPTALSVQTLHLSSTKDQDDPLARTRHRGPRLDLGTGARQANEGSVDGGHARFAGVISSKGYPNLG